MMKERRTAATAAGILTLLLSGRTPLRADVPTPGTRYVDWKGIVEGQDRFPQHDFFFARVRGRDATVESAPAGYEISWYNRAYTGVLVALPKGRVTLNQIMERLRATTDTKPALDILKGMPGIALSERIATDNTVPVSTKGDAVIDRYTVKSVDAAIALDHRREMVTKSPKGRLHVDALLAALASVGGAIVLVTTGTRTRIRRDQKSQSTR